MKKKTIANIVMAVIIMVIALGGILYVGHIKGWFDKDRTNYVTITDRRGIITLERDGVAYTLDEDIVLRKGDKISCDAGARARIEVSEGYITLNQNTTVIVSEPKTQNVKVDVISGEVFINADTRISVSFSNNNIDFSDAVALLSVRSGAQSISVFYGEVNDASSREILEWVGEEYSVRSCTIESLNDFTIEQIRALNEKKELCFTNAQLDELEKERNEEYLADANVSDKEDEKGNKEDLDINEEGYDAGDEGSVVQDTEINDATNTSDLINDAITEEATDGVTETTTETPKDETTEQTDVAESTTEASVEEKLSCTITIRCDTILNNWDNLDPAKAAYVPSSGCILSTVTVEFTEGETVFDVLNRVCSYYGIQIEYSWTPMYNSYYIEGINNLYEFDCGSESGWMYKVNGWFPNYGCSSYVLTGGETIVWCYTCNGLGADVGGGGW